MKVDKILKHRPGKRKEGRFSGNKEGEGGALTNKLETLFRTATISNI